MTLPAGDSTPPSPASGSGRRRRLPDLVVAVSGSRRLAWLYAGMHAAVVGVVAAQAWPALALAGAGLPILAHGVWTIRRHALRLGARAVVRLRFTGEETCEATHRDGSVESARIDGSSHVLAGMVVLRLRQAGRLRKRSIVLMPDAVAPDGLRRLRVRLRWGRLAEPRDAWNGWL